MNWLANALREIAGKPSEVIRVVAIMPRDSDGQVLSRIAGKAKWQLEFTATPADAIGMVPNDEPAVILCDRAFPPASDWRNTMRELVAREPGNCIILTSPVNDDHLWQEVTHLGGYDVLTKPFQEERVRRAVRFAWDHCQRNRVRA